MSKRVLVTGGAGYIGSVLVRDLLDKGHKVRVFDSLYFGDESLEELKDNPNFELVKGDLQNIERYPNLLDEIDSVMHLAGLSNDPSCDLDPYYTTKINVDGTEKLAKFCKEKDVKEFIFSSSCSVYGAGISKQLDENSPKQPVSLYAKTKLEGEDILLEMYDENFHPTILRNGTAFGYSPKMRFDLVVNVMTKNAIKEGKIFVLGGDQWRPNVHTKDISKAFITVLEANQEKVKGEIFNVGNNDLNLQVKDIAKAINSVVENSVVEMVPADQDSRDYNVNFDKITNVLGYTADYSIEAGSREIKEKILDNTIKDTEDTKYYSIKTIKNLLDTPANVTGKTIRSDFLPFALPTISENEEKEVIDTLRSGWITTGPKTKLFEEKIRRYTGIKNVVALNSCTGALHLALAALDIKQGDEVITTPITWPSTASMIIHVGAKPVFVDINRETLNIDVTKIEEKITEKTKAIIPVDLSGQPCQMDEIMEIAKKHNLKVISDSAHSIGAQYKGRNVGTIADITCFSFYTIKNITTGEGGALLTNDDAIAEKVRILSLHGLSADAWKRYDKEVPTWNLLQPGFKYNMLDLQAAIGLHQIDKLDSFIKTRESYTNIYEKEFENLDGIILPKSIDNIKHAKHLFQLVLDTDELKIDRAEFMEAMKKENIGTGIHFHSLVGTDYYAKTYGYKEEDFPNATFIGKRLVSIPLYPKMTTDDLRNVIDAVKKIIKYYKK